MKPAPSPLQAIYQQYAARYGEAQAKRWFKQYLAKQKGKADTSEHISKPLAKALDHKRAAKAAAPTSELAINKAAVMIYDAAPALGGSYPLVLALVAAALESGHTPESDTHCNTYHCMTTYDGLGYMAARAVGRAKPYTSKTIQRWLHHSAPHAAELRRWIGTRAWYTNTMRDYSTGNTMLVIGGHVMRVYLRPGIVVSPTAKAMRQQWRNLESDISAGRTAAQRGVCNVHIGKTTEDDMKQLGFAFETNSSNHQAGKTSILEEYHVYPDIYAPAGARQLIADVQATCSDLVRSLYGSRATPEDTLRTLRAIWIAVKHDILQQNDLGIRLLKQAKSLASELNTLEHSLKDPAGYVWSLIESRGFAELRRDCPGRLFKRSLWEQCIMPNVEYQPPNQHNIEA